MTDLSYWLLTSAHGATFIAAAVILLRHRHRSRRATILAVVAVAGMAGEWLFITGLWATWKWWSEAFDDNPVHPVLHGLFVLERLWEMACLLLLVGAVVADRRPTPATAAEADYADGAPVGGAQSKSDDGAS
jgi:hypothetical protein